jgi:GTP-binding protein EngB required for normal cell division
VTTNDDVRTGVPDPATEAAEVRDLATRGTPLGARIEGLRAAVEAARGHIPDERLDEALSTADRAAGRMRLSAQHTVVAIAGATGSGKSSTFNHMVGLELSSIGVRRPTTSWATAVIWGSEGAGELLQWLGIPPRHHTMRDSLLDTGHEDNALDGVVLMDLPDHDSTEVAHHLEVDRLVELADLLVWVLDPQKYADAALHDRYLKPLAGHQDVMVVVLNHIDTIAEEKRAGMLADVRRLLADDGLTDVTVLGVSAKQGLGMDQLRQELAARVASKRATTARAEADIAAAARRLEAVGGAAPARELDARRVDELEDATAEAAGIPTVVDAVERHVSSRAARAVSWPPVALLRRAGGGELAREIGGAGTTPEVAPVPREAVHTTIRSLGDEVTEGLGPAWRRSVQAAATGRLAEVGDGLDSGLRAVDLRADRLPAWAGLLQVLQWLLFVAAVVGGVWWVVVAATGGDVTDVAGLPLPGLLLVGGVVAGLVLWLLGRLLVGPLARSRAEAADVALRGVVRSVLGGSVVTPINTELRGYAAFRAGIDAASR